MTNPYQPPQTNEPAPAGAPSANKLAPGPGVCPACQISDYKELKFTWWGGALGPKMFSHVKCNGCKTTFNSKSGKSNNKAITIYTVVVNVVVLALVIGFYMR